LAAMRSTDFCHPNQSTASTHVSCAPGFFREACASCLRVRVGTLRWLHELALEEEHREAWGRSMQQGRGTVRFTTRGFASADQARGARGVVGTRAVSMIEPLTSLSPPGPGCAARLRNTGRGPPRSLSTRRAVKRARVRDPRCLPSVRIASNCVWRRTPFGGGAFQCRADVNLRRWRGAHVMRIAPLRLLRRSSLPARPPRFDAGSSRFARLPFTRIRTRTRGFAPRTRGCALL